MKCNSKRFSVLFFILTLFSFPFYSCLEYTLPIDEPDGWNAEENPSDDSDNDSGDDDDPDEDEQLIAAEITSFFPSNNATDAYRDTYFTITFDNAPVINNEGKVYIYKKAANESEDTLIDTINATTETLIMYGYGGNRTLGSVNVQNQLIQVNDKTLYIKPHFNSSGYCILDNNTQYYILTENLLKNSSDITDSTSWTFTTGSAPSVSSNTITVGSSKEFITIQGAFNYLMENNCSDDWTINVDSGDYNERIAYSGYANITLQGTGSEEFGTDVNVFWCNQDGGTSTTVDTIQTNVAKTWNYGSRGRVTFYWCGNNLTLKNIAFTNTAERVTSTDSSLAGTVEYTARGYNQAETLFFDSTALLVAYNSYFASKQDTLNICSSSGGKAWFYKCYIQGDVDFIWGSADVALFEECKINQLLTEKSSYMFETRVSSTSNTSIPKGFVLLNSTVTATVSDEGLNSAYISRLASKNLASNPKTSYDQVAVINSIFMNTIDSSVWYIKTNDYYPSYIDKDSDGNINVGWKTYGNTGFTNITADYTSELTDSVYNLEYNGRYAILNRVYNKNKEKYEFADTLIDISSYETEFSASTDESISNEYPVTKVITWNFTSWTGDTINIQSTTGEVEGTCNVDDGTSYVLKVDATSSGKFSYNSSASPSYVQINGGTLVYIPYVENATLEITVHNYNSTNLTLAGTSFTSSSFSTTLTSSMLCTDDGYTDCVLLTNTVSGSSAYIYTIKLTYPD